MHGLVRISPSNRGLIWQTGFNAILNAGMDPEVKIIYWMDLKQATHFVCCIQTSYLHFSTENVQFKGNYRNQISIAWNWKWTECWYQLGSLRKYAKWCIKPKIEYQVLKFYANMVDDNYDLTNFIRFWFLLEIPRFKIFVQKIYLRKPKQAFYYWNILYLFRFNKNAFSKIHKSNKLCLGRLLVLV